jgi:hypothetical protein
MYVTIFQTRNFSDVQSYLMSMGLDFLCGLALGKTYNDWYPLLDSVDSSGNKFRDRYCNQSSYQALFGASRSGEWVLSDGQWELIYGTMKLEHYPDKDLEALSRPYDGISDGRRSKSFRMWYLCYRKGTLLGSSVTNNSARSLRECGYILWDDEPRMLTKTLKIKIDELRTKLSHYPRPSYLAREWQRSQDCRDDFGLMGCEGYWLDNDLRQIQRWTNSNLLKYIERWGPAKLPVGNAVDMTSIAAGAAGWRNF